MNWKFVNQTMMRWRGGEHLSLNEIVCLKNPWQKEVVLGMEHWFGMCQVSKKNVQIDPEGIIINNSSENVQFMKMLQSGSAILAPFLGNHLNLPVTVWFQSNKLTLHTFLRVSHYLISIIKRVWKYHEGSIKLTIYIFRAYRETKE